LFWLSLDTQEIERLFVFATGPGWRQNLARPLQFVPTGFIGLNKLETHGVVAAAQAATTCCVLATLAFLTDKETLFFTHREWSIGAVSIIVNEIVYLFC
jgi:hypothetical protein